MCVSLCSVGGIGQSKAAKVCGLGNDILNNGLTNGKRQRIEDAKMTGQKYHSEFQRFVLRHVCVCVRVQQVTTNGPFMIRQPNPWSPPLELWRSTCWVGCLLAWLSNFLVSCLLGFFH
jgi:hypothetical protein